MGEFVTLDADTALGVATIRFDRPKVNAITQGMLIDVMEICGRLTDRTDIRAVVLTGGERNFAAGADITVFPDFDHADALEFSHNFNGAALALEDLPQVTIAAINGFALGGGFELALATDFRVAASDSRMGLPEIQLGIIPGGGGTQRISRLAGITVAKDLIYTGRHMHADEALATGLISSIHEPGEVQAAALDWAKSFAGTPASLRIAKRVITAGLPLSLGAAAALEAEGFAESFETDDKTVGVASFIEHGPGQATFSGN